MCTTNSAGYVISDHSSFIPQLSFQTSPRQLPHCLYGSYATDNLFAKNNAVSLHLLASTIACTKLHGISQKRIDFGLSIYKRRAVSTPYTQPGMSAFLQHGYLHEVFLPSCSSAVLLPATCSEWTSRWIPSWCVATVCIMRCIISLFKKLCFLSLIVYKGKPSRQDAVIQQRGLRQVPDGNEYDSESEGRDGSKSVQSDDSEVQELICYFETCRKCALYQTYKCRKCVEAVTRYMHEPSCMQCNRFASLYFSPL